MKRWLLGTGKSGVELTRSSQPKLKNAANHTALLHAYTSTLVGYPFGRLKSAACLRYNSRLPLQIIF
jgi:hypothetical protein